MRTLRIEIACTDEPGLSSMGKESRAAILAVLTKHAAHARISVLATRTDLRALVARKPDLVFLGMDFLPTNPFLGVNDPNKIWISSTLDEHGIAYTGSDQLAHELELDKALAKQRVLDAGLATSPFIVIRQGESISKKLPLTFPLFVKPTDRGGGEGIDSTSVVRTFEALQAKVRTISSTLQSDALVEEYLPGRECSVAILKDPHLPTYSVMPLELVAQPDDQGLRILSAAVKSSNTERAIEISDQSLKARVTMLALNVFHALGARDYGRIDIRLDKTGTPQFLEANLIPSLISGYGSFPKACVLNRRLDYEPMILQIVQLALARRATHLLQYPSTDTNALSLKPALQI